MKFYIQPFDATGNIDPSILNGILAFMQPQVASQHSADVAVVPVAYMANYRFNPALLGLRKYVLLDFLEMGWDAGDKENRLGRGALRQFGHLASDEWVKLDDFVRDHPPLVTFKRELFERDRSSTMLPAEFPARLPATPLQTKADFDTRPLELFNCWGLSHPARQRFHGDIFRNAHDKGIHVVDGWEQDGHFEGRTWVSIHSPHFLRKPLGEVMRWQQRAKISVSLPGAGKKCFRSGESPVQSIMALHEDDLAWSFPWISGDNCIRLIPGEELEFLASWLRDPDSLYPIYVASQATIAKYRPEAYVADYIMPNIHP